MTDNVRSSSFPEDETLALDPAFYRSYYPDLAGFDDDFLRRHFEEHGRSEGRVANRWAFFATLSRPGAPFPANFDAAVYRMLYPDVDAICATDWDAYRHYADHGRAEGRRFKRLDPHFYWELYLSDRPFNLHDVTAHHRLHGREPGRHESLETMLLAHGIRGRRWLGRFSASDFSTQNFVWATPSLNRAQALALFVTQGIDRLARFGASLDFDVRFYRELHPGRRTDRELFRHWLSIGLEEDEPATKVAWLRHYRLPFVDFPKGFAWRSYAAHVGRKTGARPPTRWHALGHLARTPMASPGDIPTHGWPTPRQAVVEFLAGLGEAWFASNHVLAALDILEFVQATDPVGPRTKAILANGYYRLGRWSDCAAAWAFIHADASSTLQSACQAAECAARLGRFDEAVSILKKSRQAHRGKQAWRQAVSDTIVRAYEAASREARQLYQAGARDTADAILMGAVRDTAHFWHELADMPVPIPPRADGRVVILANHGLPQCTHYRIEQKVALFTRLGRPVMVFEEQDVAGFLGALPGASAAIFYRVPALPAVVRAIESARAQAIPTYYEIDDLVFDSEVYPDPIDSFEGQISQADYIELMHGVPLYRAAMSLCDHGIASTTALAEHMASVVRSGSAAVLRNGVDDRNIAMTSRPSTDQRTSQSVRILYGSATLAHNRDFNDALAGPLCALMARYPDVELAIVGHLRLDPTFAPYHDRITVIPLLTDVRAFWAVLAESDINLAVLEASAVADAKSEIKWLEAAMLEVPSIVTATATYREAIIDGETGLLVEQSDGWCPALEALIGDPKRRRRIGQQARIDAIQNYAPDVGARALDAILPPVPISALNAKPRILLVNVFFPPQSIGGATRVVAGNVNDWINDGVVDSVDFAIATADHEGEPPYRRSVESYRGLPVFRITPPSHPDIDWTPEDPAMATWFTDVLETVRPDIVHFHCIQRLTGSIVEACQVAGIPYLVSVHDGWWISDFQFLFDDEGRYRRPGDEVRLGGRRGTTLTQTILRQTKLRDLLEGALAILTPSESFAAIYRACGFGRTIAVPNGLPAVPVVTKRPSSTGRVRLGHIGNMTAHKGFPLVEASLRHNFFANLELLALDHGRGGDEVSQDIWGTTPVTIRGMIDQDRIGELYADLDVLLAPSCWHESFGLVTREAHAAGLWVVAGDRGAIGNDVREGIDGFVIDVSSPEALARVFAAIDAEPNRYLRSPPRRPLRAAREQSNDLVDLYHRILAGETVA